MSNRVKSVKYEEHWASVEIQWVKSYIKLGWVQDCGWDIWVGIIERGHRFCPKKRTFGACTIDLVSYTCASCTTMQKIKLVPTSKNTKVKLYAKASGTPLMTTVSKKNQVLNCFSAAIISWRNPLFISSSASPRIFLVKRINTIE